MKALLLCKRHYTNRDLMLDRFGRNFYFPVILRDQGIHFTVIAANYRAKKEEQCDINSISFLSLPLGVFTLKKYLSRVQQIAKQIQPDLIMASGDSHFGYYGYLLAKKLNIPFVFDVYDQYQSFGSNKMPGMRYMYKTALSKADHILCTSQPLVNFVKKYNHQVSFIQNGVDTTIFKPMNQALARKNLGLLNDCVIIGYFGSMEKMRGVNTLIEACERLRTEYPQLKLLLAGKKDKSLKLDYDWIDFRGTVPQLEIATMINACNVAALPYIQDVLIDFGNSCKTAEYLACKTPIMTTRVGNFIDNYPKTTVEIGPAICEPENSEAMYYALKFQVENQLIATCPHDISWPSLAKKLKIILNSLIHPSLLSKEPKHAKI